MIGAIILAVLLALIALNVVKGPRGYQVLVEADSAARAAHYRRMFLAQFFLVMLPAIAGLAILGRCDAVLAMPFELWPASSLVNYGTPAVAPDRYFVWIFCGAMAVAVPLGAALTWRRTRKGLGPPKSIAHFAALLPRNRTEVVYGAGISLAAGVGEELYFRLLLPVLLATFIGGIVAMVVAILLFGLAHSYQGWKGVVTTSLVGTLLTLMYLMSGSLLVAMVFHVVIDAMTLVIRPVIRGAWARTA
jgi:membrane protease YdiL (CAAX protease family)